jgi:hypothetical protein
MKKIMKTYMTEDARHNEHILRWKRHIEEDEEARKTNEDLTNGRIQVHHEV